MSETKSNRWVVLLIVLLLTGFSAVTVFNGCNQTDEPSYLTAELFNQESHGVEVYKPVSMLRDGDDLWIVNRSDAGMLRYDSQLNLISQEGRSGEGPGEYIRPLRICKIMDSGYAVLDIGTSRISILDAERNFVRGWLIQYAHPRIVDMRVSGEGKLICSLFEQREQVFTVFDTLGTVLARFGDLPTDYSSQADIERNGACFDFSPDGNLFVAFKHVPIIRSYNLDLSLAWERRISSSAIDAFLSTYGDASLGSIKSDIPLLISSITPMSGAMLLSGPMDEQQFKLYVTNLKGIIIREWTVIPPPETLQRYLQDMIYFPDTLMAYGILEYDSGVVTLQVPDIIR